MDENPRITELRKKLEKDPGSRLFAQLAEELRKDGKHGEAVMVARRGLEKNPNYPSARLTLARALLDSGQPREARPELEQIVKAAPDNILAGRLLGEALEDLGEVSLAIQQFERTLVFAPGDKAMAEIVATLKARNAAITAAAALPPERAAGPAALPSVEPAPSVSALAPEPVASPVVASSIALDRDLASGTFSPGSLTVADLQKHFEAAAAAGSIPMGEVPSAGADVGQIPTEEPQVEATLGFGELERSALSMDTAETVSLEMEPSLLAVDPAEAADTAATHLFGEPVAEPPVVEPPVVEPPFAETPVVEPPSFEVPSAATLSPEFPALDVPEGDSDPGAQTLPLTSLTLADLYLQQGLKAEASAVLSQVIKDEPENTEAKSKLAGVSESLVGSFPEPEEHFVEASAPAAPEPLAEPIPAPTPLTVSAPLTRAQIRDRTIVSLKAFQDAVERESVHQRATELSIR